MIECFIIVVKILMPFSLSRNRFDTLPTKLLVSEDHFHATCAVFGTRNTALIVLGK